MPDQNRNHGYDEAKAVAECRRNDELARAVREAEREFYAE